MKHSRLGHAAWLAAALAPAALGSLVTFDTPGELTGRFDLNTNNSIPIKFTQTASGGLGNTGAVDYLNTTDADHTTAVFNEESYAFASPGDSVTISHYILRRTASQSQTPWSHLGIVSDLDERMDAGSAANSFASIRLDPVTSALGTDVVLRTETKVNGAGRLRTTVSPSLSLTAGNWYLLSTTFTYVDGSSIDVSASLEDWCTTGAAFVSSVFNLGATNIALSGLDAVNGDGTTYAAFRDFHEGGADLTDNFFAVPEPSSAALLLGVLVFASPRRS